MTERTVAIAVLAERADEVGRFGDHGEVAVTVAVLALALLGDEPQRRRQHVAQVLRQQLAQSVQHVRQQLRRRQLLQRPFRRRRRRRRRRGVASVVHLQGYDRFHSTHTHLTDIDGDRLDQTRRMEGFVFFWIVFQGPLPGWDPIETDAFD